MKTIPTVLIVGYEDRSRTSLTRHLKMRGYDALDVDNGEDGIELLRSRKDIEVVLLDRKMAKLAAEQALEEMKAFRPELHVIMLSGHRNMESAMESGRLEAAAYLPKPYEMEKLLEVLRRAYEARLRKKSGSDQERMHERALRCGWEHTECPGCHAGDGRRGEAA
jgi:two-component system NtrC family response regulator